MESLKVSNRFAISSLFIVYLGVLVKFILFRRPLDFIDACIRNMEHFNVKNIKIEQANFIPFKLMLYYLSGSEGITIAVENVLGNFIGFMPLGLLAPLLFDEIKSVTSMLAVSFFISFSFEIVQLITGLGYFDVDDLILNSAGGVFGYLAYGFFTKQLAALNS